MLELGVSGKHSSLLLCAKSLVEKHYILATEKISVG